jgi:2,4-dienoyl-CoA reductase-like NADH-dependent reductase (Old Yellow Enzyme family)
VSKLFESTILNGLTLPNRFVRSATWEGMAAADGACTAQLTALMERLVDGGVGLIVTGHTYVHRRGQAGPRQLGVYSDDQVPGLQRLTDAVHRRGGRIVLQLAHAGLFADTDLTGQPPLAPSPVKTFTRTAPDEMSAADIHRIVTAFGDAAARARTAGFDGVQIHAAHGYLLSQFLSPAFNRRTDAYGGSLQNRARIVLAVLADIRRRVGRDCPVLIKLNTADFVDGGLVVDDAVRVAELLTEAGIDAIELSGGTGASGKMRPVRTGIRTREQEAYFRDAATAFRRRVSIPLMLVGGIRSYAVAEEVVADRTADYISMSRPFIREPDLINRWRSGDLRPSPCRSDNRCFVPIRNGEGLYCVTAQRGSREDES